MYLCFECKMFLIFATSTYPLGLVDVINQLLITKNGVKL